MDENRFLSTGFEKVFYLSNWIMFLKQYIDKRSVIATLIPYSRHKSLNQNSKQLPSLFLGNVCLSIINSIYKVFLNSNFKISFCIRSSGGKFEICRVLFLPYSWKIYIQTYFLYRFFTVDFISKIPFNVLLLL